MTLLLDSLIPRCIALNRILHPAAPIGSWASPHTQCNSPTSNVPIVFNRWSLTVPPFQSVSLSWDLGHVLVVSPITSKSKLCTSSTQWHEATIPTLKGEHRGIARKSRQKQYWNPLGQTWDLETSCPANWAYAGLTQTPKAWIIPHFQLCPLQHTQLLSWASSTPHLQLTLADIQWSWNLQPSGLFHQNRLHLYSFM